MRVFDSHVHIFNSKIVGNVIPRTDLVRALHLEVEDIENRLSPSSLTEQMKEAGVVGALMLPTADVNKLVEVNRNFIETASGNPGLYRFGTSLSEPGLRPRYQALFLLTEIFAEQCQNA